MDALELETPHGVARAHVEAAQDATAALLLGHGAAGSVTAPDLVAVASAATELGLTVVLVEQPYKVAGRKSAAPAHQLDAAWIAVVEQLRAGPLAGHALVAGGRSSGARVACRTAAATSAAAVLCLAFPLQPPQRRSASAPPPSRQGELDAVAVPVLVIQGERDSFGLPADGPQREVAVVAGDHRLRTDLPAVAGAARAWLPRVVPATSAGRGVS